MRYVASYNRPQCGMTAIVVTAATAGAATILFPSPLVSIPVVVASTDHTFYGASVDNVTATGCRLRVKHFENVSATTTVNVSWIVVL